MDAKRFRLLIALVVVAVLIFVGASSASAQPFTTPFTGTSTCVDAGGTEPVVKDGKLHFIGAVQLCDDVATDDRVSGTDRIVIYGILDLSDNLSGPLWGTARIENEGGIWVGVWTGERTSQGFTYLRMHAHGLDGYKGMQAWWELERLSPDPYEPYSMSGRILNPGD
jgi:hypothetical protein